MFRSLSIVLLLLAYVAGTGHCALATALCLSIEGGEHHTPRSAAALENTAAFDAAGTFSSASAGTPANIGALPSSDASVASTSHADCGHLPHGAGCSLEKTLVAPVDSHGAKKVLGMVGAAVLVALFCVCARCLAANAPPVLTGAADRGRGSLLLLAHGWQFTARAAGFARAP
jgi:hypothetical protein